MTIKDLKLDDLVKDQYFNNGEGKVISIKDQEVRVKYPNGIKKYSSSSINNLVRSF